MSILAMYGPRLVCSQDAKPAVLYNDGNAAEKWLLPWLQAPGAVSGGLHLGRFADRTYYTLKEIGWRPGDGQMALPAVTVPAGFVTDLASIPRVFWSLLPSDGQYTFPAIVHDYLYWTQTTSREDADLVFRYGMEDMKIDAVTVAAIYNAVRLGGEGPWNQNARLRNRGERRFLVELPEDPTITWEIWKTRAGVLR